MTPPDLRITLEYLGPALKNHLWQSTIVAMIAASLTLALRKNHARTRYCLWLAASLKFLIPFSLLVNLGSLLTRHQNAPIPNAVYSVMNEVSQPFTQPVVHQIAPPALASVHQQWSTALPLFLAALWLAGLLVITFVWLVSWRRVLKVMREAAPMREGRELQALRRVERAGGVHVPIRMLSSPSTVGPAVYGIRRPILLWPARISPLLDNAQLESVLAHELCHVRRRDNLTAALHMVAQAIFWFHPFLWWAGFRLEQERERACDEHVLEITEQPYVYAESILKVCESCLESPLPCISGITGSDLQQRIRDIMSKREAFKLNLSRKILLGAASIVGVAVPILSGQVTQNVPATSSPIPSSPSTGGTVSRPRFEAFDVATIKPVATSATTSRFITLQGVNRFVAKDYTLKLLIAAAYDLNPKAISGGPDWVESDHYDILALSPGDVRPNHAEQMAMLRRLLTDRFGLTFRREQKEFSIYALEVANGGPKLKTTTFSSDAPPVVGPGMVYPQRIVLPARNATMDDFVSLLQRAILDRPVVDMTGLSGRYDFDLEWAPDETQFGGELPPASAEAPSPPLFKALPEQLGLRLEARKGLASALVIEKVNRPSEN